METLADGKLRGEGGLSSIFSNRLPTTPRTKKLDFSKSGPASQSIASCVLRVRWEIRVRCPRFQILGTMVAKTVPWFVRAWGERWQEGLAQRRRHETNSKRDAKRPQGSGGQRDYLAH